MSISDNSLISVVIPTFNREKILPISLESALVQSYQNIEIIIVDDHSNDDTEAVVKQYQDDRIHFIRLSKNSGGAVARNVGIDAAKGEYIAFLDSDDAWAPNKLERQFTHIQNHTNPKNVVSYTQVFHSLTGISKESLNEFNPKGYFPKRGKRKAETVGDYILCNRGKTLTSTLMMYQKLAKSTRFRNKFRKHQDWDFCLRLEKNGAEFSFINEPLTIWNGDPSFDHVGRNPNYELSEYWLSECSQYLSERAISQFRLDKILPSLIAKRIRKPHSQKILMQGFLARQISLKQFLTQTKEVWI